VAEEFIRRALEAAQYPREREKSKAERALQLIEESKARSLELFEGMAPGRCGFCNGLAFLYKPPAFLVWKCRKCDQWNRILDEASNGGG
jgi:hypothetical protein